MCLESSVDVKVGWEVKQKWELATDINEPTPYVPDTDEDTTSTKISYATDTITTDVQYKYTWKLIPYGIASMNLRPNAKLDKIA